MARGTAPAPAAERRALDSPPSNGRSSHAPPALARPAQKPMQGRPTADAAAAQRSAFADLQPVCAPLLALRGDPGALAAALERLEEALPGVEPLGLAACLDYVLFPLMFTVDSAALLRASPPPGAAQGSAGDSNKLCVYLCSHVCCWPWLVREPAFVVYTGLQVGE